MKLILLTLPQGGNVLHKRLNNSIPPFWYIPYEHLCQIDSLHGVNLTSQYANRKSSRLRD